MEYKKNKWLEKDSSLKVKKSQATKSDKAEHPSNPTTVKRAKYNRTLRGIRK